MRIVVSAALIFGILSTPSHYLYQLSIPPLRVISERIEPLNAYSTTATAASQVKTSMALDISSVRRSAGEKTAKSANNIKGLNRKPRAWVTIVSSSSYMEGVYALYGSISRFGANKDTDFVVVTTCGVNLEGYNLNEQKVKVSKYCGDTWNRQTPDSPILRRLSKLLVFKLLNEYQRIMYVDTDIHFLRNPSALFTRRITSFGAVPGQAPDKFNSGLFVVEANGFSWNDLNSRVEDMLSCTGISCAPYVDRMSKSADDQGFLNAYYKNRWEKLSEAYNTKLMFYLTGKRWSLVSKPKTLNRNEVIGLHFIGPSKPWNVETWYPCGNTKKFCPCTLATENGFRSVLQQWHEDYQKGKQELLQSTGTKKANEHLWSNDTRTQLAKEKHQRAKRDICRRKNEKNANSSSGRRKRRTSMPKNRMCAETFQKTLSNLLAEENFFVVQIGANDGVSQGDVVFPIAKYENVKGVLMEPQPNVYERLRHNYKFAEERISVVNAALGHKSSATDMFVPHDMEDGKCVPTGTVSGLATMSEQHAFIAQRRRMQQIRAGKRWCPITFNRTSIRVRTFDDLSESNKIPKGYSLLQVDVEGLDDRVIYMTRANEFRPMLIRWEHKFLSKANMQKLSDYLTKEGYMTPRLEKSDAWTCLI